MMARAAVRGIELEYETFGDRTNPPLLLVMGLAYQMIEWDVEVCRMLADRGFWVIRFDNRDVGHSSKLDDRGLPDLMGALSGTAAPPYTLDDMAEDAVALLDALDAPAAHVVGASMGGMIAQLVAINHPDRVLSLTSIMSTVGGPNVVQPEPEVAAALIMPPGPTREERIDHSLAIRRLINGEGVAFDEKRAREKATLAVDRSFHPEGAMRQFVAILAAPDRAPALGRLPMPVLIIHGEVDPLVPADNGRQTAAAIPGARLMMIPGMGHNLPPRVWPQVLDAIVAQASTASSRSVARSITKR
jgi:pimeloyl-ACP methyl ester carboxylesterase